MKKSISNKLACEILHSKIQDLDLRIANLPDFLADDLKAERRMYEKHLEQLRESSDERTRRI